MVEKRLTEEQLEELRVRHTRIATIEWNGHELVFRKPSRDECRSYRVKLENVETKVDAAEQLCQQTIIAFDGDLNTVAARTRFTGVFLEETPMFAATAKCRIALGALMGLVEEEDLTNLGKGVSIRPSPQPPTPTGSPTGSPTVPAASN
jgi:hypothetical protein